MEDIVIKEYSAEDLKACPCCGSSNVSYEFRECEVTESSLSYSYFVSIRCNNCGLHSTRDIQYIDVSNLDGSISMRQDIVKRVTDLWNMRDGG